MLEQIKKLFVIGETQVRDGLSQDQREAMIDLLQLCIYADNELHITEGRIFKRQIKRYNWESDQPIEEYIQESKSNALGLVRSGKARNAHLVDIGIRLGKKDAKFQALKLCKILFYSDCILAEGEQVFIDEIRSAFGLN